MNTRKVFLSVVGIAVLLAMVGTASAVDQYCKFGAKLLEPGDCVCPDEAVPIVVNLTYSGYGCEGNCTVETVIAEINGEVVNLDTSECDLAPCYDGEKTCNCTGMFDSTTLDECSEYDVDVRICYLDCDNEPQCIDIEPIDEVDVDNIAPTFELDMDSDICVCEGEIIDLEVDVEDDCCSGLNKSTAKAVVEQDGELVKTVDMTCDDCPCYGELNTTGMGGDYKITFTAEDGCGNVGSATLVNLTVDVEPPVINEAKAIPDTISMMGIMDRREDCDPWEVLECNCEACRQTHSFGPAITTLVVNTTDECIGDVTVTRNYSAIIYQMFGQVINGFTDEEKENFDSTLAEILEDNPQIEEFKQCCENSYSHPMISIGPVIAFFIVCDKAGIDIEKDIPMILLEKIQLGDIEIPITVEDECGNIATTTMTVTIVDYQVPMKKQWNVRSVPIALKYNKWEQVSDGLSFDSALRFESSQFVVIDPDYTIRPLEAFYIHMIEFDQMPVLLKRTATAPPTRELNQGYNLIGPAILPFETMRADLCLKSIEQTSEGLPGYTNVVSILQVIDHREKYEYDCDCLQIDGWNKWFVQKPWVYTVGQEFPYWEEEENPMYLGQEHYVCKGWMDNACGYWVYMENSDTLAGFTTTPVYLINPDNIAELMAMVQVDGLEGL